MKVKSQNVTDVPGSNTIFMVWNFTADKNYCKETFEKLCALVVNLNKSSAIRFAGEEAVSCTLGIGYDAWKVLDMPAPLPRELANFSPIKGSKHTAVATKGDLHLHIRAGNPSIAYDMSVNLSDLLSSVATCVEHVCGFRYWDGRSILGFVDGTENPQGEDRDFFAKVGEEDEKYKGGSYLFVQKYIHDMSGWNALEVSEQEKVIGRYKASDIEMIDEIKPKNSHSALANVGDDKKVVRDNMPFVSSNKEVGTYFIAYASTFLTLKEMLESMFIGRPQGNYDRILDFSEDKTGTLFFVPTFDMLSSYSADSE